MERVSHVSAQDVVALRDEHKHMVAGSVPGAPCEEVLDLIIKSEESVAGLGHLEEGVPHELDNSMNRCIECQNV